MTGNVINLRQARKQRARAERRQQAEQNREMHGLKRAAREQAARDAEAQARRLDGHWLSPAGSDSSTEATVGPGPLADPDKGRDVP